MLLLYQDLTDLKGSHNPRQKMFKQEILNLDEKYIHIKKQGSGSFIFESQHRQMLKEIFESNSFSLGMFDTLCLDIVADLKSLFVDFAEERTQGLKL